jgi:hypothetical protein
MHLQLYNSFNVLLANLLVKLLFSMRLKTRRLLGAWHATPCLSLMVLLITPFSLSTFDTPATTTPRNLTTANNVDTLYRPRNHISLTTTTCSPSRKMMITPCRGAKMNHRHHKGHRQRFLHAQMLGRTVDLSRPVHKQ